VSRNAAVAAWRLAESELRQWLDELIATGLSVVAPAAEDRLLLYRPVVSSGEIVLARAGKTRWSAKEFLFPRSEPLYRFAFSGDRVIVSDPEPPRRHQLLFGLRPCDAAGLLRLDEVFLTGDVDPLYAARRERTAVVSLACAGAGPECFCTAVGGSPAGEDGGDILLLPLDDGWLLRPLTERGLELVGHRSAGWQAAVPKDLAAVERLARQVADEMGRVPFDRDWSRLLESGFDHPAWQELAARCLGCGACASVCPTCTCFDMNLQGTVWGGEQCRSWDGCTLELFTRHASGHNPRPTQPDRYRQRVLHKFAFRTEGSQGFRCVGCGRCIELCPSGMDIAAAVRQAVERIRGGADGEHG
jgi:ferredoxin